jgi:hypothetical protein
LNAAISFLLSSHRSNSFIINMIYCENKQKIEIYNRKIKARIPHRHEVKHHYGAFIGQ